MKATTLISAFLFAHAAFAQATESASTSVSAGSVPASSSTATASVSAPASQSTTKSATGAKSASKSEAQSSSAAGTPTFEPAPASTSLSETLTSSSGSPLIPSSISAECSSYLVTLNSDPEIAKCLSSLSNAVSAYSGSASDLTKTLNTLSASGSDVCSSTLLRAKLTEFKDNCSEELTGNNPNQMVIRDYDALYIAPVFKQALSVKQDDGSYCLLNPGSSATNSSNVAATTPASSSSRRKRAQTVTIPKPEAYRSQGLMYLSTSPNWDTEALCTPCTSRILNTYAAWQVAVPHALGAANSPFLGGQKELWSAIGEKCSPEFVTGITANVKGADPMDSGASPTFMSSLFTAAAGALVAVMALI